MFQLYSVLFILCSYHVHCIYQLVEIRRAFGQRLIKQDIIKLSGLVNTDVVECLQQMI